MIGSMAPVRGNQLRPHTVYQLWQGIFNLNLVKLIDKTGMHIVVVKMEISPKTTQYLPGPTQKVRMNN